MPPKVNHKVNSITTLGGTTITKNKSCTTISGNLIGTSHNNIGHSSTICKNGKQSHCITWKVGGVGGKSCVSGSVKK